MKHKEASSMLMFKLQNVFIETRSKSNTQLEIEQQDHLLVKLLGLKCRAWSIKILKTLEASLYSSEKKSWGGRDPRDVELSPPFIKI